MFRTVPIRGYYAVPIAHPKPFCRWHRWSTVILSYRNRKYIDLLRVLPKQFINMVYGDLWLLYKNRKLFSLLYKEKRIWIINMHTNYKCSSLIHIRFSLFQVIYHSIMFCNQVVKFNHNQSFGAILTPDGFGWAISTAYILMTVYCANISSGEKNLDSKEGHLRLSALNECVARI